MNETLRRYLVSSLTTFLTMFFSVLAMQITAAGSIEFTSAFWIGVLSVAARAAVKAVIEAVPTLGGSADKK